MMHTRGRRGAKVRSVLIAAICGLIVLIPSAVFAQWVVAPSIAKTDAMRLSGALKLEWSRKSSEQQAPICWGRSHKTRLQVSGTVYANARDNPGTLGVSARVGGALDMACQGKLTPPDPTPRGGFDFGTIGIGPSFDAATNQAGDEVMLAPGLTAFYLARGGTLIRTLMPDIELTLAANRPLRSARRDAAGLALGWERRWDAVGYWHAVWRDADSAPAFAPVGWNATVHAWHLNSNARAYANETASERIATDVTLRLQPPHGWRSIASIDVSWRDGRLPEQPERRSALGLGVTLR